MAAIILKCKFIQKFKKSLVIFHYLKDTFKHIITKLNLLKYIDFYDFLKNRNSALGVWHERYT